MKTLKGFCYALHINVGTKNEVEACFLQTRTKTYLAASKMPEAPFRNDVKISPFVKKMVEIQGEPTGKMTEAEPAAPSVEILLVKGIKEISDKVLPS